MRAAVVHSWGDADQLGVETVPDPTPEDGEVLVELRASSLNWHDVIVRQTGRGFTTPSILGMDGAGTRLDTGDEIIIYPCLNWGSDETTPGKDFSHPRRQHRRHVCGLGVRARPQPVSQAGVPVLGGGGSAALCRVDRLSCDVHACRPAGR